MILQGKSWGDEEMENPNVQICEFDFSSNTGGGGERFDFLQLLLHVVPTWSQVRTSAALIEAYDFSMTIYRKRRRTLVC